MLIKSFGNFFKKTVTLIHSSNKQNKHYAIRGAGLSYNDAAIYENVKMAENNKFLMNLSENEVRVAAGMKLENINRILNEYNFELPVTPGTMLITAGGAFASNIHGKSHHIYGAFADVVKEVVYVKNDGSTHVAKKDSDEFNLLAGSFGMLYEITELVLEVKKIKSNALDITHTKCDHMDELITRMYEDNSEYTVAWFDSSFYKGSNGRGIYMSANEAQQNIKESRKTKKHKIKLLPSFILQSPTIMALMNNFYFKFQETKIFKENKNKYLYPLDKYLNWDNAYGIEGMVQFQCVIPEKLIFDFVEEMKKVMIKREMVSFVSVLKRFGKVNKRSPLDFPIENGYTIAMDFAASENNLSGIKELISIVNDFDGKVYLAKDSLMTINDISLQYKEDGIDFLKFCLNENQGSGLTSDMQIRLLKK